MGDVPSDKDNSPRGAEGTTLASDTNASTPTPGSGTSVATQSTKPAQDYQQMGHGRYGPASPMNMNHMAYSLPNPHSQPSPFEPHLVNPYPHVPTQGMVYPMQSVGHYPGQASGMPYGMSYTPAYSPYLPQHPGTAQHGGGHYQPYLANRAVQSIGAGQPQVYGNGYYTHPYATAFGHATPLTGQVQAQAQPHRAPTGPPLTNARPMEDRRASDLIYDVSKTIVDGSNPSKLIQTTLIADPVSLANTISTPSTPRGPPRKPKQSGHALWVGNLPPGTNVMDLKDHFSQEATNDIESVFLISKSNCAFVNYKSASACAMALGRFHDSRFQGVRLVCRLRKGLTVPGSGSMAPNSRRPEENTDLAPTDEMQPASDAKILPLPEDNTRSLDRYFIVKSLTVEDLELSKQSGIWATQTHNETNLNQAFETTDHVYLIFSANKSGEYFGYARMLSPISDDEELALEMPTRPEPLPNSVEELDVIQTSATSTAPKGRIIDDSARGTIFWEVESLEDEHDDALSEKSEVPPEEVDAEGQAFGKPFRIQWLSTARLPFHRTRGLRNPWNANREVKIARDGTEIETTVGRKLLQLFHQV
ncbi:Nucleotide-binding alpha-beta plait [Penicillium angulare]|uniref:Nucleotide-binding alpha-beta plait n=1 Tax=Penicillium angulare TaxID=116970 RepID=UPI0025426566|nr:Nucleotide-binding alpha-beta plait [Penicillium angulare]KAJ5291111.1 Nucleotide-binding alpha-beta plait [Penicillium angulare]